MTPAFSPDPKWTPLLEQAAQLIGQNNLAAAEGLLARVLSGEPANFDALQLLRTIRSLQNNLKEAEQLFRHALGINPRLPHALLNLGHLLRSTDRLAESVAYYRQTVALIPDAA